MYLIWIIHLLLVFLWWGQLSSQNPKLPPPVIWFPRLSTAVEHHLRPATSGSGGHPLYFVPLNLNGNMQGCLGSLLSDVVKHFNCPLTTKEVVRSIKSSKYVEHIMTFDGVIKRPASYRFKYPSRKPKLVIRTENPPLRRVVYLLSRSHSLLELCTTGKCARTALKCSQHDLLCVELRSE